MEKNQKKSLLFGLFAVLLWSTVASAFKLSLRYYNPSQLLLYASFTSFSVLCLIIVIQKKVSLVFSYTFKEYSALALLGLINPFLYYLVLFKAYALLPAQEAQPLNYTWALTLSYLSVIILGHKLHVKDIMAGFLCYIGVMIISTHGDLVHFSFTNLEGVLLALFSTLLWSLYWLFSTRLSVDPVIGLCLNFAVAIPFIFGWTLIFSDPFIFNVYGFLGSVYVGTFEMGCTFVLWLSAMKYSTHASQTANLIFISPFISLCLISLILGETILMSTFIGLVLIILGLMIQKSLKV